jgi:hypothetical protein
MTFSSAPESELLEHVARMFTVCRDEHLNASQALSLVCASKAGWEAGFRKLSPADLWERYGRPIYEAPQTTGDQRAESDNSSSILLPKWWGSRFELWAERVAPDVPTSFRRAMTWAVLTALFAEHVATPIGDTHIRVGLAGASVRARDDALRLGGLTPISVESSLLASLSAVPERMTAIARDNVTAEEVLRERQGPPEHSSDPMLALLISEALDGLERAQSVAGGALIVRSSGGALDAVTAFRKDLAVRLPTQGPGTMDDALSGSARLVRSMGALVAVADGSVVINETHQAIAIEAASDSVRSVARYLETERWIVGQA